MATIKDVAAKAGVSTATVSRVLNKSGDVSDKTRRKVECAINDLNFHPNAMAQFLQTGRSRLIGMLLPELDHPYFARLLQAVETACASRGYHLLISVSEGEPEQEIHFASLLRRNNADGLLLCSRTKDSSFFVNYGVPVITVEYLIGEAVPSVCCDNYMCGQMAATALLDGGCRYPLVLGEHPDRVHLPASLRLSGFTDECKRRGIPCVVYGEDKTKAENSKTYL